MPIKIKRSRTLQVSETSISDHSSAAAVAVAANDDLLTEILLRLPARPLLRFKSVSKHWLSLITNPNFSLLRNRNPNPTSGLFLYRLSYHVNPEFDFVPLNEDNAAKPPFRTLNFVNDPFNFVNDPFGIHILQSCNGLLCCCSYGSHKHNTKYYIYNPTTKHFTTLPGLGAAASRIIYGVWLAFDPSKSPNYKVVCVRGSGLGPDNYQIEIYSSQTGPWRVSGKPFTAHVNPKFGRGVYWNGSIHWLSYSENSLYFNVHRELLEKMPMPLGCEEGEDGRFQHFGESGDHLNLVEATGLNWTQYTVYEMERDYSKWSVKYIVDLNALSMAFPEMIRSYLGPPNLHYYLIDVFLVVRGEKNEDSFLVLQIPGKAIRYNFEDKSFKKIYAFDPGDPNIEFPGFGDFLKFSGCSDAFPYIESLACV